MGIFQRALSSALLIFIGCADVPPYTTAARKSVRLPCVIVLLSMSSLKKVGFQCSLVRR